ncbi:lasso peptide biosynthesis PqqD family chaperone [Streptomyces sp. NPDC057638]|uniref:lasso peptide biosynthesis PqqD family chaperone n=1 Tax=Streptomyces sp. NPDC057638 TaxID=3346190 RepID=UPI0036B4BFB5
MSFTLAPHITLTETDGGLVLLDERAGRYWQMNDTGALVLRTLLDGGTTDTALAALRERFPAVDPERAAADVRKLVAALRAAKMVVT